MVLGIVGSGELGIGGDIGVLGIQEEGRRCGWGRGERDGEDGEGKVERGVCGEGADGGGSGGSGLDRLSIWGGSGVDR